MTTIPGGNFYFLQPVQQVMPLQLYQYLIPKLRGTRELPKRAIQKYIYFVKKEYVKNCIEIYRKNDRNIQQM